MHFSLSFLLVLLAVSIGASAHADPARDCSGCPAMVAIRAGTFVMGSTNEEIAWAGRAGAPKEILDATLPRHRVAIAAFALSATPITRDQFAAFVQATGHVAQKGCLIAGLRSEEWSTTADWRNPGFSQAGDHPVVCVNWSDAKAYADWLSKISSKHYRLPSEAEWEYAARASVETARYWGTNDADACRFENVADAQAMKRENGQAKDFFPCDDGFALTAPVGHFKPNPFGLYDMHGNVRGWMADCYHPNYSGAPSDGSAWDSAINCKQRVLRGGSWSALPLSVRAAHRGLGDASGGYYPVGFRVARSD